MKQDFEKIRAAIRYWQLGRKFYVALKAMDFAQNHHTGLRKDKITPEFQHQVSQANFARTLIDQFMYPEETLSTIWLHDVVEDCGISLKEIRNKFGDRITEAVDLMTNSVEGIDRPTESYYVNQASNPIASLSKGIDRMHNHQSMSGVFTKQKQLSYILETEQYILPMLKLARKNFPEQESAYQNIKHILQIQIELVKVSLDAENF